MARGKAHKPEVKAAVMAALLQGQLPPEVASSYKLPVRTVREWGGECGIEFAEVRRKKKEEIGDLIVQYLRESLTTLSVQQKHFRDKAWLNKQDAAEAGTLHGITADKAIRILEALEAGREEAGLEQPEGDRESERIH